MILNEVSYNTLKTFIQARGLSVQYFIEDGMYVLFAIDDKLTLKTKIKKEDESEGNQLDFETNYKPNSNKPLPQQQQPFSSKTLPNGKKLFARTTGFQATLTAGANVVNYTATYLWAKVTGIEIIGCEALDAVQLKVFDTTTGTYSTIPDCQLNQFGYTVNLPKDFYSRMSSFDADLYVGMIIKIEYTSISAKTVGFNLILNEVK